MYCLYMGSSRTVSDSRVLGWPYLPQDAVAPCDRDFIAQME